MPDSASESLSFTEAHNSSEEEVKCVCEGRVSDTRFIICDGPCNEWYHAWCVGMSKHEHRKFEANSELKWFCKLCEVYEIKEFEKQSQIIVDDGTFYDPFALECGEKLAVDDDVVILSVKKPVVFVCERGDLRQNKDNLLEWHKYIVGETRCSYYSDH